MTKPNDTDTQETIMLAVERGHEALCVASENIVTALIMGQKIHRFDRQFARDTNTLFEIQFRLNNLITEYRRLTTKGEQEHNEDN